MVDFIKDLSELPDRDDRQMTAEWGIAEITSFDVESSRCVDAQKDAHGNTILERREPVPTIIARAEDGPLLIIDSFEWKEVGQILHRLNTLGIHDALLGLKVVYNKRDPSYFVGVICAE